MTLHKRFRVPAFLFLLSLIPAFSACGIYGSSGSSGSTVAAADATVIGWYVGATSVQTTVKAGSTVTWTNMDEEPHTVVSTSGTFRSNALDTKDSFSFKFDKPGTYSFVCTIHPQMVGTIIVQ